MEKEEERRRCLNLERRESNYICIDTLSTLFFPLSVAGRRSTRPQHKSTKSNEERSNGNSFFISHS